MSLIPTVHSTERWIFSHLSSTVDVWVARECLHLIDRGTAAVGHAMRLDYFHSACSLHRGVPVCCDVFVLLSMIVIFLSLARARAREHHHQLSIFFSNGNGWFCKIYNESILVLVSKMVSYLKWDKVSQYLSDHRKLSVLCHKSPYLFRHY